MKKEGFILKLYQVKNTVFTTKEIVLFFPDVERKNLKARINYYVKKGVFKNVRKGIYVKSEYNPLELATRIYTPSHISLENVLEKEGVIFQHYKTIFVASYLTRKIEVDSQEIQYRRIKESILLDKRGILEENSQIIMRLRIILEYQ